MTVGRTGENPTSSNAKEKYDDLTKIKGIGPTRQALFRESFGVRTYLDFAELEVDEVETELKAAGHSVSRAKIEEWQAKARNRIQANNRPSQPHVEPSEEEQNPTVYSSLVAAGWEPSAVVMVKRYKRVAEAGEEQLTTVEYLQVEARDWAYDRFGPNETEIVFEQLPEWIQDQESRRTQGTAEAKEKPQIDTPTAVATLVEAMPVCVKVTQVRVFQPPKAEIPLGTGKAGAVFGGTVKGGQPFALEASFELCGPAADDVVKRQTTYNVQFYVRNLTTRAKKHLGDTKPDPLIEGKSPYTGTLPEVTLQSGLYCLRVLATLQGMPPIMGYLEVPMLQVV
jgi:hypothetical protein